MTQIETHFSLVHLSFYATQVLAWGSASLDHWFPQVKTLDFSIILQVIEFGTKYVLVRV